MNEWKWTISGENRAWGLILYLKMDDTIWRSSRNDFRRKVAIWGLIPFLKMDGFAHPTGDHLDTISGEKS